MSGQNTLVVIAEEAQVNRPSDKWNWQVFRDTSAPGSGIYKAMNNSGVVEIIGGPNASTNANTEGGTFSRLSATGSGVQVIATTRRVKYVYFNAKYPAGAIPNSFGSIGNSIGLFNSCIQANDAAAAPFFDHVNCINVQDETLAENLVARITNITDTSFELTWVKIGVTSNISLDIQWQAITN